MKAPASDDGRPAVLRATGREHRPHVVSSASSSHVGSAPSSPAPAVPVALGAEGFAAQVSALERTRIVDALALAHGNQTQAAKLLGMSRRTLISRLDALALPRPRKGQP